MHSQNNNCLDGLAIFSDILQVQNYIENAKQTKNDELMQALEHQNQDYLELILRNQTEILNRLERLENERFGKSNGNI